MFVLSGKKSRTGLWRLLALVGLLALFVLPAGAERKPKQSFGVYTGMSVALGDEFVSMNSGGHTDNRYTPNFILGIYLQHNFSDSFGLQLNMNYQNISNHWEFNYWDRHDEMTESIGGLSLSLNGIATVSRSVKSEFYLLGGFGIFAGGFENLGALIQLSAGAGTRLPVKPGSSTSVNLAVVFHHLLYKYGHARSADYLRLQAGLEFLLKNR